MRSLTVKKSADLCSGSLWDKILLYTLPIILSNLIQLLYTAADIAAVGWFAGEDAVAAVGVSSGVIHLVTNVFIGISAGASIRVAYYIGSRNQEDIHQSVHTTVAAGVLFGVVATFAGILATRPVLVILNTAPSLMPDAVLYTYLYFSGLLFTSLYNFGAVILRAGGDTRNPLRFLLISGFANVALNLLLTGLFDLGVAGVAIATAISQLISAILVFIELFRTNECYRVYLRHIRIYPKKFLEILRYGIPSGLQTAMFSLSNLFAQSALNNCDLVNNANNMMLAGCTAAGTIENMFTTCINSFLTTVVTFTGQNYGAGKLDRVDKVPKIVLLICSCIYVGLVILVMTAGRALVGLSIQNPVAIEYGLLKIRVIVCSCLIGVTGDVLASQTRSLGSSLAPMIVSILCICGVRVIYLNWVYPHYRSLLSVLLVYPLSYAIHAIFQYILYRRQRKYIGLKFAETIAASKK